MPILFVDVNIDNQIKRLFIHKGDSSEKVAEEFYFKNSKLLHKIRRSEPRDYARISRRIRGPNKSVIECYLRKMIQ